MTLVIALKWKQKEGEGLLVTSDSRATSWPIAYEVKKVHPIFILKNEEEIDLAVAAGAGNASIIKQSYELAETVIKRYSQRVGFRNLTEIEFKQAVSEIEDNLIRRFNYLRSQGINPSSEMILGTIDPKKKKVLLYRFNEAGLAEPVYQDPGFAIIGAGSVTGGLLLTRLLGYSPEESHELDLGLFSAFVIDMVSEINPTVGPFVDPYNSIFVRIQEGRIRMGPLQVEVLKDYKKKIPKRKKLIQLLQRVADQIGEEKVEEELKNLLEKK